VVRSHTIVSFRVLVLTKISHTLEPQLDMFKNLTCPSWAFHLLMVFTFTSVQNLRTATVTLQLSLVCCQTEDALRSTA
jgi:hypothetical protein